MFADQIAAAVNSAAIGNVRACDDLARAIWQAVGSGVLDDAAASAALDALHERRRQGRAVAQPSKPRAAPRKRPNAERRARLERRRRLVASGPMPPALAAHFTQGELAVLCIVANEVRAHGCCALHIAALATIASVGRTTVKNALRQAQRVGLILVKERRRRGQRSLTNIIKLVSVEWSTWIRRGGVKKLTSNNTSAKIQRSEPGFGGAWSAHYRHYDPKDRSGRAYRREAIPRRKADGA
jgi:hypothetical protein